MYVYLSIFNWEATPRTPIRWADSGPVLIHPQLLKTTYDIQFSVTLQCFCFYSHITPWYCLNKRVFRINSRAFFMCGGWVNIFFHSTTPNGSLRCSSFLSRLNFRHSTKICRTVCKVWPHSHRSLSTIFRLCKNERSPIFPFLICTSKELCGFFLGKGVLPSDA